VVTLDHGPRRALVAGLVAVAALAGCAAEEPPRAVDERLLAALGLAQGYQHQADELAELGDRDQAIARVQKVLEIPFPQGSPEGEDVRLDAWGRLAELRLDGGDEPGAEAAVESGLGEAHRVSYFKARLFAVRGRVLQARAARLREAGEAEASRQASRDAIAAFEQSIELNREVLGLEGDAGAAPADENGR
jgi:hypothetical protein